MQGSRRIQSPGSSSPAGFPVIKDLPSFDLSVTNLNRATFDYLASLERIPLKRNEGPLMCREFDFVVDIEGDLTRPRLEFPKHVEYRWLGPLDIAVLDENRDGGLVRGLVQVAFQFSRQIDRSSLH